MRLHALLLLSSCLLLAFRPAGQEQTLAPDGKAGLGQLRTAREFEKLFRKPAPEQQELLTGLNSLLSELLVLRGTLQPLYRRLGYLELGPDEVDLDLDGLHALYAALWEQPFVHLAPDAPRRAERARLYLDLRLRLRRDILLQFEHEASDLRRGLWLLRATTDGFPDLKDGEAREIAWRVDLAAARLRAMRLDLEALHEEGEGLPGRPDPGWVIEVLDITAMEEGEARQQAFDDLHRRIGQRFDRLGATLFLGELDLKIDEQLVRRDVQIERAARLLLDVRQLEPSTPEGEAAPEEISELRGHERHMRALRLAADGLSSDPLNDELCWFAGVSGDYLWGKKESLRWFDRFLALHGIRAGDERTYRDRSRPLNRRELRALDVLQSP